VAASPEDEALARRLGVVALVEACRDEHLASLGADDGLAALAVDWRDVVARAASVPPDAVAQSCPSCGARLRRTRPERCRRCGLEHPILRRRSGSS
jgi:hypothetical protein